MTINQYLYIRIKKWLFYSLLSLIILGIIFPNIVSSFDLYSFQSYDGYEYQNLVGDNKLELSINSNQEINPKIQAEDPEAYFPNFLLYSIETANALIDYLYDDESGGFYTSSDEYWNEQLINKEKRTYDNAQAILALLKLSDAVVNETERYFALDTAEKSAKYLITQLYNSETGGFYISTSSLYKKPGIQAKAIQALLSLYEITGNLTYKEIAINTFEFLEDFAWDNDIGAYYYLLSPSGTVASSNPDYLDPFEPYSKRVDHNILMANAVLDLYGIELNEKYLTRAIQIYNFFNSTCRNNVTGLFYTGLDSNNALVDPSYADVFINSLVLEFLSYLYDVTGNEVYKEDFFNLLFIVMKYYWDDLFGGYWATYSYNSLVEKDEKKYTERQFYVMRALDEAYAMTDNSLYYNLILDIVEILNNKLYDHNNAGYFQLTNNDGTPGNPFWNYKYTVTQSLAIYELSNLWLYSKPGVLNALWAPSTPRPQDSVTILVAAFDADGISNVFMNYSLNNGPYQLLEMVPQSNVGSMYNCTLESQYEGTTINFNIIVNDTLGNIIIRGSYFFLWQVDIWAPQILEIGFDPDFQIPIRSQFSITVSAVDIPSQGTVKYVRMYYHKQGGDENSLSLNQIDLHLWKANFPKGISFPGTYAYYFEAIDNQGNFEFSSVNYFEILGGFETLPMPLIIGSLFLVFILVPAVLYTYVEYKKKTARKTLKTRRKSRYYTRGKRRAVKLNYSSQSHTNTETKTSQSNKIVSKEKDQQEEKEMMKETQISSELNKFEEKVKSKNKRGTKRTRRS